MCAFDIPKAPKSGFYGNGFAESGGACLDIVHCFDWTHTHRFVPLATNILTKTNHQMEKKDE